LHLPASLPGLCPFFLHRIFFCFAKKKSVGLGAKPLTLAKKKDPNAPFTPPPPPKPDPWPSRSAPAEQPWHITKSSGAVKMQKIE
jgi:hypothetical protein